ncbi:hypothetical protein F2Q69_00038093 [Brassica cretica]|uniref:Uncharacterized protein n=1 Tax=Brassica cretica TaxID=69181 RepID=A0A8S9SM87_BRACR|nr:hypothetical protein F2Q69_00038093 [Brassica cretica]
MEVKDLGMYGCNIFMEKKYRTYKKNLSLPYRSNLSLKERFPPSSLASAPPVLGSPEPCGGSRAPLSSLLCPGGGGGYALVDVRGEAMIWLVVWQRGEAEELELLEFRQQLITVADYGIGFTPARLQRLSLFPRIPSRRGSSSCRFLVSSTGCGGSVLTYDSVRVFGGGVFSRAVAQGVPDPSSDVRDPRATLARDLFLVRDSIKQLASDDQGVPDQATKDVRDPIEATRSIPARVPFVSSSRLNSFGGPIQ